MTAFVSLSSRRMSAALRVSKDKWDQPWFPISCPASCASRRTSGQRFALLPRTKKVAGIILSDNVLINASVFLGCGPSSNVSAILKSQAIRVSKPRRFVSGHRHSHPELSPVPQLGEVIAELKPVRHLQNFHSLSGSVASFGQVREMAPWRPHHFGPSIGLSVG
jgi:hypothetical protein